MVYNNTMPAKSEKQRRFMAMCLYNKNKAQSNCPPKDVADKFVHGHENTINSRHALKTLFEAVLLESRRGQLKRTRPDLFRTPEENLARQAEKQRKKAEYEAKRAAEGRPVTRSVWAADPETSTKPERRPNRGIGAAKYVDPKLADRGIDTSNLPSKQELIQKQRQEGERSVWNKDSENSPKPVVEPKPIPKDEPVGMAKLKFNPTVTNWIDATRQSIHRIRDRDALRRGQTPMRVAHAQHMLNKSLIDKRKAEGTDEEPENEQ